MAGYFNRACCYADINSDFEYIVQVFQVSVLHHIDILKAYFWSSLCLSHRMKDHQINHVSLRFVDAKLEEHYSSEKEKRSGAAFCCCIIVLLFITAMEVFIDPL